jgi:alpha-ribazole phosphatase
MEIYVIRHTTPDIEKGICYGQTDVPLKATFDEEAKNILNDLPTDVEIIYTSPLIRCKQLAIYISDHLNVPIVEDIRLKELNFGDWEMKKWDDLDLSDLTVWMNDYVNEKCPNGESYIDLYARVFSFLNSIKPTHPKKLLIVTHGGVAKALHSIIKKVSLKEAMDLKLDYGDMHCYTKSIELLVTSRSTYKF